MNIYGHIRISYISIYIYIFIYSYIKKFSPGYLIHKILRYYTNRFYITVFICLVYWFSILVQYTGDEKVTFFV